MIKKRRNGNEKKKAFVIMPIKGKKHELYSHYLSIYSDYIRPVLEEFHFEVTRADEISTPGSIDKSIIEALKQSDLVVADLTDLNPNVFYELGVRHSLCASGTVMIIDNSVTEKIPFDVAPYRVIMFENNAPGLTELRKSLRTCVMGIQDPKKPKHPDNPVHDWLGIPSQAGRRENPATEPDQAQNDEDDIQTVIDEAISEAEADSIPKLIIETAEQAVKEQNLQAFLNSVRQFIELKTFLPSEREYRDIYFLACRIDARSRVTESILKLGIKTFPESGILLTAYISYLAHSAEKKNRDLATKIVLESLKITIENGNVVIKDIATLGENVQLLSLMLDAYHRDGRHAEAFQITTSLVEQHPESTVAIRNHARAMEKLGRFTRDEVIAEYRRSIMVAAPDDTSATWYGSMLIKAGRWVDAVEAYLLACLLDLDEARCYAELALVISDIVQPRNLFTARISSRPLPTQISRDSVSRLIMLATECANFGVEQKVICEQAMMNIGWGVEELDEAMSQAGPLTRTDRRVFVEPLYSAMKSEVTAQI